MIGTSYAYEQGPIRPPSEAGSLLLRLTRNCPWNRCLFCPVYKGKKFSRRSIDEIKKDIRNIYEAAAKIDEISSTAGYDGQVNNQVLSRIRSEHPELLNVAFWQYQGGENVFLQDGDSLLIPAAQLIEVLELLKKQFPGVKRITTYARSRTLLRRTAGELIALKEAGLSRIHVGLESGNDAVLEFMQKGVTGSQHVAAGELVKTAGISLSEYVILGLGGKDLWREHALDTAKVLNQINPDFIRIRTLAVHPASPLYQALQQGAFKMLSDDQVIREEALFIDTLDGIDSQVLSDHILNLLEEVCGKLPEDKAAIQKVINDYLTLPEVQRERFRLGRRTGHYRKLRDFEDPFLQSSVESIYRELQKENLSVDQYIQQLMLRFI